MPSRSPGRPFSCTYTPERGSAVVCRLSSGRSLRAVCQDPDMPASCTVLAWARKYPDFAAQIDAVRDRDTGSRRSPGNGKRRLYTEALGHSICAALAEGFTLAEICRSPAVPVRPACVIQWARRYPQFGALYAAATAPRATDKGLRMGQGRRTPFDPVIGRRIIDRLLQERTLDSILKDPDIPCRRVIDSWRRGNPQFRQEMQHARRFQLDLLMDAVIASRDRPELAPRVRFLAAALHRVGYLPFAANVPPPPTQAQMDAARRPPRKARAGAPGIGHNSRGRALRKD